MADKKINWQPLSMIPVIAEMVDDMLKSAEIQLTQLKQAEDNPYKLDDDIIEQILESYREQRELISVCLQQCQHWEKNKLNNKQKAWVSEIKELAEKLSITNHKIIKIAETLSGKTINTILGKSDLEIALDFVK